MLVGTDAQQDAELAPGLGADGVGSVVRVEPGQPCVPRGQRLLRRLGALAPESRRLALRFCRRPIAWNSVAAACLQSSSTGHSHWVSSLSQSRVRRTERVTW